MGKHPSVFIKVVLYTFDVVSDWLNGWNFLNVGSPVNVSNPANWTVLNDESSDNVPNSTTTWCLDDTERHTWWGVMTIGMSWIPAVFAMIGLVMNGCSWWHPLQFILWPLLVPFHM